MNRTVLVLTMLALVGCAGGESKLNYLNLGMDRSSVAQILGAPHTRFARDPYEYFMYELTNKTTVRKGATCAMYGFLTVGLSWINCPDDDTYFVRFEDNRVEAFGRMGDFTPVELIGGESRKQEISSSTAASRMFLGK